MGRKEKKRGERLKESGTAKSHETDSRTPRRDSTKFDLSRLFLNQSLPFRFLIEQAASMWAYPCCDNKGNKIS